MAKDPAFLFYYQDFFTGVSDLTNEEVGAYIRCLCIQASKKGITEKHMINICNSHDVHSAVKNKFFFDEKDQLWKNQRLIDEIEKRRKYSESRANNSKGTKNKLLKNQNDMNNISKTYVKHMEDENENEISRFNLEKDKGGMGEKEKTNLPARMNAELTIQMSVTENNRAHDVIDMQNNLPRGSGKKMAEIFLSMLDATGELQKHNPDDMGKYFINWANYHAKRLRPMLENAGNKSEVVSTYFEKTTGKQTTDEMLKSLHAYLK